jgi:hypothetical protein
VPYHGLGSAKNARGFRAQHAAIDPELDVGIEHGDERVKVAIARSGEERIDDLPLSRKVRIRLRGSRTRRRARLASCCAAASERSRALAMSANGTSNTPGGSRRLRLDLRRSRASSLAGVSGATVDALALRRERH